MLFLKDSDKKRNCRGELHPAESRRVLLTALCASTTEKEKNKIAPPVLMALDKEQNLMARHRKQVRLYRRLTSCLIYNGI